MAGRIPGRFDTPEFRDLVKHGLRDQKLENAKIAMERLKAGAPAQASVVPGTAGNQYRLGQAAAARAATMRLMQSIFGVGVPMLMTPSEIAPEWADGGQRDEPSDDFRNLPQGYAKGGAAKNPGHKIAQDALNFGDYAGVISEAFKSLGENPRDPLAALGAAYSPMTAAGRFLGDQTLDATGSPLAATIADTWTQFGAPGAMGGLKAYGKAAASAIQRGMQGAGPMGHLQYFAPNVIKNEGGQYFPGQVDEAIQHLIQSNLGSRQSEPLATWLQRPFKKYVQNRMATPSDEVRQLLDQTGGDIAHIPSRWYDRLDTYGEMDPQASIQARSVPAALWENDADAIFKNTRELADIGKVQAEVRAPAKAIRSLSPKQQIGAMFVKTLNKGPGLKTWDTLPEELQAFKKADYKKLSPETAEAFANYMVANPQILDSWGAVRGKPNDKPIYFRGLASSLKQMGSHLALPEGTPYTGTMYKANPGMRHENGRLDSGYWNPFAMGSANETTIKKALGKGQEWVDNVPADQNIWSIDKRALARNTDINHMVDVLATKLQNGELTPEALINGRVSVADAFRHVQNYDDMMARQAKKAEQKKLEAITGNYGSIKHPDGWQWLTMPDTRKDEAARKMVQDMGCRGGWCTREQWRAEDYGSGGSQLHILVDPEGRPHVQAQVSEAADGYNIPQFKPRGNSWDSALSREEINKNPEYKNQVQQKMQDFYTAFEQGNDSFAALEDSGNHWIGSNWDMTPVNVNADLGNAGMVYRQQNWTPQLHNWLDNNYSPSPWVPKVKLQQFIDETNARIGNETAGVNTQPRSLLGRIQD